MNIREILTVWNFKTDTAALKKVEGSLDVLKNQMSFLVGNQIIKGLIDIEQRFAAWAHNLNSVSIASNVAVETIQQLAFAGAQFGATQEEITGAMTGLTLKINEAKMGFEGAQRAFSMAGFTGAQINSWRNGNDALMALADRMKATTDPIRRQGIAAELGVSANSKLYAMLQQGSGAMRAMAKEANELGVVMDKGQVKALVDAQNAMSKFNMVIASIGKKLAAEFAPAIQNTIDHLLAFYKANRQVIEVQLKKWVDDVMYAMGFLYGAFEEVATAIVNFAKAHPVLFRRMTEIIAVVAAVVLGLTALGAIIAPLMISWITLGTVFSAVAGIIPLVGGALAALLSPVALWIAGITALALGVRSLWQVFHNGMNFKDTELGKGLFWFMNMCHQIDVVIYRVFGALKDLNTAATNFVFGGGLMKKIGGFLFPEQEGGKTKPNSTDAVTNAVSNLNSVPAVASAPSPTNKYFQDNKDFSSTNSSSQLNQTKSNNDFNVNSPITININSNQPPMEIAKHVSSGIGKELGTTFRNLRTATKPVEVH